MTSTNMRAIQTVTVGAGGAASIQFTSIPQTYTDLIVKLSVRTTRPGTDVDDEIYLEFNGSGGTAYSVRVVEGNGTTTRSAQTLSSANMGRGLAPSDNATANTFSNCEYYITNYAGSTNKSVSFDNTMENNATQSIMNLASGLWSNTSAITSMKFTAVGTFDQYSTATLYGVFSAATGAKATGGNIIFQDANYWYHTFTSSGTFAPTQALTAEILCVAGGGGAANAGAGAGGLSYHSGKSLSATNYTVTIGAGGSGAAVNTNNATNGSNSVFSDITSIGGGASKDGGTNGASGGSGAGSYASASPGTSTQTNTGGATGYGNSGGASITNQGGGGGGAGAAGGSGGPGGVGRQYWNGFGIATFYAGGGGTYNYGNASTTAGGNGGGGAGGSTGVSGTANTGGGAGAGVTGGNGGSGIVIVRYAK